MQTPVPIYNCPSRRDAEPKRVDQENCETCGSPIGILGEADSMTRGDYAVNIGDAEPDRNQLAYWPSEIPGPADLREAREWTRRGNWPRTPDDWSGVSYQRRGVRLTEITDGLSSTIYVGEKYVDAAEYESGADWGDNEGLFSGFNNDNHRSTHPLWPYIFFSAHLRSIFFAWAGGRKHAEAVGLPRSLAFQRVPSSKFFLSRGHPFDLRRTPLT